MWKDLAEYCASLSCPCFDGLWMGSSSRICPVLLPMETRPEKQQVVREPGVQRGRQFCCSGIEVRSVGASVGALLIPWAGALVRHSGLQLLLEAESIALILRRTCTSPSHTGRGGQAEGDVKSCFPLPSPHPLYGSSTRGRDALQCSSLLRLPALAKASLGHFWEGLDGPLTCTWCTSPGLPETLMCQLLEGRQSC